MATTVLQGFQSCIEPQMVETRTLRLKLSSPNLEVGCWNFTNTTQTSKQNEPPYVHPMSKKSSFYKLSEKSLDLCTEYLGCETGTDMSEDVFSFSPMRESNEVNKGIRQIRSRRCSDTKKENFPPPLTTMNGACYLQMRPIREGRRLVIEAVEASIHSCFQAQRRNGRLILSLFRENDQTVPQNKVEEIESVASCEKEEENFDETEEDCEGVSEGLVDGVMEGHSKEVEAGKFQLPRRCMEGLCTWEPFWVATS